MTEGGGGGGGAPEGWKAMGGGPRAARRWALRGSLAEEDPAPGAEVATGKNVRWVRDEIFGRALACDAALNSTVDLGKLPGVGARGPFALNFWMRQGKTSGEGFEYVVSLADDDALDIETRNFDAWRPNSLHVYVPESGHEAHGVIRFIYKDSDDLCTGRLCQSYIDSDGAWMNNSPRDTPGHVDLEDGRWHMITLSTMPSGGMGFTVYVDGVLAAVSPPRLLLEGMLQSPDAEPLGFGVDGGDPFTPNGRLKICGRSDANPDRHYTGRLAELEVFDSYLTPDQVFAKYLGVVGQKEGLERALSLYMNQVLPPHADAMPVTNPELYRNPQGPGAAEGDSCVVDGRVPCMMGLMCIPNGDSLINLVDSEGLNGLCVKVPLAGLAEASLVPGLLPSGPDSSLPVPRAFFPLTGGSASSWPFPFHKGEGGSWVEDPLFLDVLQCEAGARGGVVDIKDTQFASKNGPFAINMWVRKLGGYSGGQPDVFFSTGGAWKASGEWDAKSPNQAQLAVNPEGKLQVVVRDFNDEGVAQPLTVSGPGAIPDHEGGDMPSSKFTFNDQMWHMVTVTTLPSRKNGIDVYVDGFLAYSEKRDGSSTKTVGGSPIFLPKDLRLCGRSDGARNANFEGRLAHLMLFDEPLGPGAVAQMYATVRGKEQLMMEVDLIREERGESELDVDTGAYDDLYDYPDQDRYMDDYGEFENPAVNQPVWGNADDGGNPAWGNADDGSESAVPAAPDGADPAWGNADDGGDGADPAWGNADDGGDGAPAPGAPKPWEGSPHPSWPSPSPTATREAWPSPSGGPVYPDLSPNGPINSRDSAAAGPGGGLSATASQSGGSGNNNKAVVAGVVGGLAGVLVAGLVAGGVYIYMRKKRVTLPLTRAKMAESASKRYSQFDGEQPRSTDPLPVDVQTPGSQSGFTEASNSSNPADV